MTTTGPLTDAEIRELLGSSLHGPLPVQTMPRVFATLAEALRLRALQSAPPALTPEPDDPDGQATVFYATEAVDGPGWYYVDDEYADEGVCGAFATAREALAHAGQAYGHVDVAPSNPFAKPPLTPEQARELRRRYSAHKHERSESCYRFDPGACVEHHAHTRECFRVLGCIGSLGDRAGDPLVLRLLDARGGG